MKKLFISFFAGALISLPSIGDVFGQTNPPVTLDQVYSNSTINSVVTYPSSPTPPPPNGLYFNMGSDFHPYCPSNIAAYLGNNTNQYVTVTDVVDFLKGGSTINLKSSTNDFTLALGAGNAIDPDVVVLGNMAICVNY